MKGRPGSKWKAIHYRMTWNAVTTACGINLGNIPKEETTNSKGSLVRGCHVCENKVAKCKAAPVRFSYEPSQG